jgi:hypothetical protein
MGGFEGGSTLFFDKFINVIFSVISSFPNTEIKTSSISFSTTEFVFPSTRLIKNFYDRQLEKEAFHNLLIF